MNSPRRSSLKSRPRSLCSTLYRPLMPNSVALWRYAAPEILPECWARAPLKETR